MSQDPRICTIKEFVEGLGFIDWVSDKGVVDNTAFAWPPDAFAMAATVLRESGAYLQVARPHVYANGVPFHLTKWLDHVALVAAKWRRCDPEERKPPQEVCDLFQQIGKSASWPLHELSRPVLTNCSWLPFVLLMTIADQASRGAGCVLGAGEGPLGSLQYPQDSIVSTECMRILWKYFDDVEKAAPDGAFLPATLCKVVDPSRAVVLPKMRTSQRGVTIRSLSLHLALLNGTDIEPVWHAPSRLLLRNAERDEPIPLEQRKALLTGEIIEQTGPYNLVLFPWPFVIRPTQFRPLEKNLDCLAGRPPPPHRFFTYDVEKGVAEEVAGELQELVKEARKIAGHVHGIVLPELALTRDDFNSVFAQEAFQDVDFVACGIGEASNGANDLGRNYTVVRYRRDEERARDDGRDNDGFVFVEQEKHHRWALDQNQVKMYGLASVLKPGHLWWEAIRLPRRNLHFFSLDAMTVYTVLVCEDLARPDPVADAIRAVGPNLVVCLLMDGPQLGARWSARYATVLADDPGSSVLTLSSLGMVERSRQRHELHRCSRTVALWREPGESPCELQLDAGAQGLLLSLFASSEAEQTIDGREDEGVATVLRLASVHQLHGRTATSPSALP